MGFGEECVVEGGEDENKRVQVDGGAIGWARESTWMSRFEGEAAWMGLERCGHISLNFQVWDLQGSWMCNSENSGERLSWTCAIGSNWHRGGTSSLGNGWNQPRWVWGAKRSERERPTFLWIEKEEPRRNTKRRVRELEKSKRGQYSES